MLLLALCLPASGWSLSTAGGGSVGDRGGLLLGGELGIGRGRLLGMGGILGRAPVGGCNTALGRTTRRQLGSASLVSRGTFVPDRFRSLAGGLAFCRGRLEEGTSGLGSSLALVGRRVLGGGSRSLLVRAGADSGISLEC